MRVGDYVEKKRTGKIGTVKGLARVWLTVQPHHKSRKELWRRDEVELLPRTKRNPVRVAHGRRSDAPMKRCNARVVETFGKAHQLRYVHIKDGESYRHDFSGAVVVQALDDGSLRLYHPSRRLWGDFEG